jgi:hypothetical protein
MKTRRENILFSKKTIISRILKPPIFIKTNAHMPGCLLNQNRNLSGKKAKILGGSSNEKERRLKGT